MSEENQASAPAESVEVPQNEGSTPSSSEASSINNAFDLSNSSDKPEAAPSNGEVPREAFHVNDFNIHDATSIDDAKAQLGRMKAYIGQVNGELKGLNDKQAEMSAPEAYEFKADDNLKMSLDADSEQLKSFNQSAKEMGLTQGQYNKVMNDYLQNESNARTELENDSKAHIENVLTDLGSGDKEDGMKQLRSLTSQLSEMGIKDTQLSALQESLSLDVEAIKAVQHLIKSNSYKNAGGTLPPRNLQSEYEGILDTMTTTEYKENTDFKNRTIGKLGKIIEEAAKHGIKLSRDN